MIRIKFWYRNWTSAGSFGVQHKTYDKIYLIIYIYHCIVGFLSNINRGGICRATVKRTKGENLHLNKEEDIYLLSLNFPVCTFSLSIWYVLVEVWCVVFVSGWCLMYLVQNLSRPWGIWCWGPAQTARIRTCDVIF